MSITVRPGQGALSHAWRCGRIRRTARQSKCAEARHLHHAGDRRASAGSSMDPPIAEAAARPQVRCRSRGVSTRYGTHADAKLAFPSFAPASHHNRRQAGADARSASGSACVFPVCNSTSLSNGPRCGARTRAGRPCRSSAVYGKRHCRMHGGALGIRRARRQVSDSTASHVIHGGGKRCLFHGPGMVAIAPAEKCHQKTGINQSACRHSRLTSSTFSFVRSGLVATDQPNR